MNWKGYISTSDWHYNLLALLVFVLPVNKRIVPVIIVLIALYGIVQSVRRKVIWRPDLSMLLLAGVFVLHLTGMVYSEHPGDGWKEIGIKASFVAFPLLAMFIPPVTHAQRINLFDVFTAGCLLFAGFALGMGVFRYLQYDDPAYLFYSKLAYIFHPSYMALYQVLAFLRLAQRFMEQDYLLRRQWVHTAAMVVVTLFIAMLASKAGLLSYGVMLVFFVWTRRHDMLALKRSLALSTLAGLLIVGLSLTLPVTAKRITTATRDVQGTVDESGDQAEETGAKSSTELRKVAWRNAWELMKTHPVGVGTGDVTPELVARYEAEEEWYAAKKKLNAHNHFLQCGAEHGWLAVLLWASLLVLLLRKSFRMCDEWFMMWGLLLVLNLLVESFLEVQAGIVFFCAWAMIISRSALPLRKRAGEHE